MLPINKLVLATGNSGKLKELRRVLAPLDIELSLQSDHGVSSAEETGLTFIENAILKARHASSQTGLPALADDSGIEVDALQGEPGIYSARFAGSDANDADNNKKLLEKLAGIPAEKRTARYQCVLVLLRHAQDPTPVIAQSSWEGIILDQPQGDGGFGYDPLFWLPELSCTAAELEPDHKNRISHRGKAIQNLLAQLQSLS